MRNKKIKYYSEERYFELFEQMLASIQTGKRNRNDGQRISKGTHKNYIALHKHLLAFAETKKLNSAFIMTSI